MANFTPEDYAMFGRAIATPQHLVNRQRRELKRFLSMPVARMDTESDLYYGLRSLVRQANSFLDCTTA